MTSEPLYQKERISPTLARQIIEKNNEGNRPVKEKVVDRYAEDMAAGAWSSDTGETIKFGRTGRLLDGQHRLRAVIKAGQSVMFLVARNIDDQLFSKIDTGAKRTGADVLGIEYSLTGTQSQMANAAIGLAVTYLAGKDTGTAPDSWTANIGARGGKGKYKGSPTNKRILEFANENPEIIDAVKFVDANWGQGMLVPRGIMAWVSYETRKLDADDADLFVLDIMQGSALNSNDPVMQLRKALIANSSARHKVHRKFLLAALVKTWNRRRGRDRGALSYTLLKDDWNSFPRFQK